MGVKLGLPTDGGTRAEGVRKYGAAQECGPRRDEVTGE